MTDSKREWGGGERESGVILLRVAGKDDGSAVHIGAKASEAGLWGGAASLWAGRRPQLA